MGLLYERNCGNCEEQKCALSSGYCDVMGIKFIKTGDGDFAENCPNYKNKYGFHESGLKEKDITEFINICKRLNKLMKRIRAYCPEARYYLANESLHLMKGCDHDMRSGKPCEENSVENEIIFGLSGGDW